MSLTSKYKKNFGKGWYFDSWKHSLAAKGIKTKKHMAIKRFKPLRQDIDITAARRFGGDNLKNLPKVGEGRDREVLELPEQDVVVKIAKNPGGLQQNVSEGDYIVPVPEIKERGKDFVVVAKADKPGEATKDLLKDLKKFNQTDFDNKTSELQEVFRKHEIDDLLSYDVDFNDLQRKANWGEIKGEPVLVDAGTLNNRDIQDFRIKQFTAKANDPNERNRDFYRQQLQEWEDIKRERKQFQAKNPMYDSKVVDHYERDDLKIPITMRKTYASHRYPITVDDLKESLDKLPSTHLKGIEEFSFRAPSRLPFTEQTKAWAQYADKANRVNIYSQAVKHTKDGPRYKRATKDFDEFPELRKQIKTKVIPHEIGHHYALDHKGFKNDTQEQAEAHANFFMKDYMGRET